MIRILQVLMVDKDDLAKLAPNRLGDRWHHENQGDDGAMAGILGK
jgi:hypothetical protein